MMVELRKKKIGVNEIDVFSLGFQIREMERVSTTRR